ncbi:MAG: hypothetical protein DSY66_06000 [Persephonella sp.]|nr:MAG: hypothetical protein DSY66_06000 [Persephonella sp.]RUM60103.1 MAG: hypothetical protein DSY53_01445 [Persephonella sp.]
MQFFKILTFIFLLIGGELKLFGQEFIYSINGKIIPSKEVINKSLNEDMEELVKEEEIKLDVKVLNDEKNRKDSIKILFVGDSMVEAIERPSKNICHSRKLKCDYIFKRGLRTDAWTRSDWYSISLILKISEFRPDIVVISSGTNDIYNRETPYQIYKDFIDVINLIREVSYTENINPKIVIVAPPIPNDKNLNRFLEERFKNKKNIFVIQSKYFHLKLADGIHPDVNSSKIWAKKIINFVEKLSKN